MDKNGVKYLEYLTRFGLNQKVLKDFKRCGMLHISDNQLLSKTKPFTDLYVKDEWIELVKEVELSFNVSAYHIVDTHIIHKLYGETIVMLYSDNELDDDDRFNEFKHGETYAYILYPSVGMLEKAKIKYKVKFEHLICEIGEL